MDDVPRIALTTKLKLIQLENIHQIETCELELESEEMDGVPRITLTPKLKLIQFEDIR